MKKILLTAVIAIAVALAIAAGVIISRWYGSVSYSDSFEAVVTEGVVLERDINGVPLVRAKNLDDAFFGLGFLHGQDRFALMEYYRALANGRIGDLAGDDGPVLDRISRGVGFRKRADELRGRVREPHAGYLKAYVRGVNASAARLEQKRALNREWDEADVIAILLLKEWANAFLNNRELLFGFQRGTAIAELEEIIPDYLIRYYNENESDCAIGVLKLGAIVRERIGTFDRGYAFFLPASKMGEKGKAAGYSFDDPLSIYPGWYPVHMRAGDLLIRGITHAGLPFLFTGDNGAVIFCGLSADADVQDLVAPATVRAGESFRYQGAEGWRDFESAGEEFSAVRLTEYGPVLNDIVDTGIQGPVVAVRSQSFDETYIASLFEVPLSKSLEEAMSRVRRVVSFPRVHLFISGDGAVRAWSGMVPIRNRTNAMFLSGPGATVRGMADLSIHMERSAGEWTAGSSFLSDAPAPVRDNAVLENARYERLKSMLARRKHFTVKNIENVLIDSYSAMAREFVPLFLSIMRDNPLASVRLTRIYFQNWKWRMKSDFNAPSIYHMFMQYLMHETFGDELKEERKQVMAHYRLLEPKFLNLLRENNSRLFDDVTTYPVENRDTIFDRAFLKTMRFFNRGMGPVMNDWKWGNLHDGHFAVPDPSGEMMRDALEEEPFPGSNDTLQLGTVGPDLRPATVTSLSGIFAPEESLVLMHFNHSTNPRSRFYYGAVRSAGTMGFRRVYGVYFTEITPRR